MRHWSTYDPDRFRSLLSIKYEYERLEPVERTAVHLYMDETDRWEPTRIWSGMQHWMRLKQSMRHRYVLSAREVMAMQPL